jgi:hypothetical protein
MSLISHYSQLISIDNKRKQMSLSILGDCLPKTFCRWQKFGIKGHDFGSGIIFTLGCFGDPSGAVLVRSPIILSRSGQTPIALDSEYVLANVERATRIQSLVTGVYDEAIPSQGNPHELLVFGDYVFINFSNTLYRNKLRTAELEKIKENVDEFTLVETPSKKVITMMTPSGGLSFIDAKTLEKWGSERKISSVEDSYGFGKIHGIAKSKFLVTFQGVSCVKFFDLFFEKEHEATLPGVPWTVDVQNEKALVTLQHRKGFVVLNSDGKILNDIKFTPEEVRTSANNHCIFIDDDHVLVITWEQIQIWDLREKKMVGELTVDKRLRLISPFRIPLTKEEEKKMVRHLTSALLDFSPLAKDVAEVIARFI